MTIEQMTVFLGWCSAINLGLLILSTIMLVLMRDFVSQIHSRLFGVEADKLRYYYFQYLGQYKLLVLVFNVVPYIVLRVMF